MFWLRNKKIIYFIFLIFIFSSSFFKLIFNHKLLSRGQSYVSDRDNTNEYTCTHNMCFRGEITKKLLPYLELSHQTNIFLKGKINKIPLVH